MPRRPSTIAGVTGGRSPSTVVSCPESRCGTGVLPCATVAAASLFVDSVESTTNEAGDYLCALNEGAIGPGHIRAELGEVLNGTKPGRTSRDEITLFKSLGLAVEDLAVAEYLYRKAKERSAGTWVGF